MVTVRCVRRTERERAAAAARRKHDRGRWVVGEGTGEGRKRANGFRARTTFYETLSSPYRVREYERVMSRRVTYTMIVNTLVTLRQLV